eukprot:scaffold2884_cov141-Skeletonema_menzelii.AAC.8
MDPIQAGVMGAETGATHPPIPSSANDILATVHLQDRCFERKISPFELNAAIKYGTRTEGEPRNGMRCWKFNYKGITYLTSYDMDYGITAYPDLCFGFDLEKVTITQKMKDAHDEATRRSSDHHSWNSHVVVVVDQSGSMRNTDATKSITRSDLVWLTLALDYIGKRLRTGEATSKDFLSLVELGGDQEYLLRYQPIDWILYNRIVDLLRGHHPCGGGNYLPAIDKAHNLLSYNRSGKCALQLIFLTDGAPSDFNGNQVMSKYESCNRIASLARRFGSRLTVGGFCVGKGKFSTLEEMVKTAEEYNCKGFLMKASLRVEDVSSAFCQMSTLITDTKTTMTDFKTNSQRTYRDLIREPKSAIRVYVEAEKEWKIYSNFLPRNANVVRTLFDRKGYQWVYPERTFESDRAVGIAVRDYIFGEGRERAVRRVREVNSKGQFVGRPLVGKETLFQEDLDPHDVRAFHKNFCKLQQLAEKYAVFFNRKLLSLPGIDCSKVPTIQFLDCWVMMFDTENNKRGAILVEKMLDHEKYTKWNTNGGYVRTGTTYPGSATSFSAQNGDYHFTLEDIPQAYSHFTYNASGRRFLVCDLQGVLDTKKHRPVFELTDPAIHYRERTDRRIDFGRTDLGEQGIDQFFRTHECSDLCRMVCRQWIDGEEDDIIQYESIHEGPSMKSEEEEEEGKEKTTKRVKFAL